MQYMRYILCGQVKDLIQQLNFVKKNYKYRDSFGELILVLKLTDKDAKEVIKKCQSKAS